MGFPDSALFPISIKPRLEGSYVKGVMLDRLRNRETVLSERLLHYYGALKGVMEKEAIAVEAKNEHPTENKADSRYRVLR